MIDQVENLTQELKDKIFSLPEVKEYLRLENLIEKDKMLKGMRIEIAKLNAENKIKERDILLEEYNSIPLIANYNSLKEEVYGILKQISIILK